MNEVKWANPNTGEKFIHRESPGRRELLFDINGNCGGNHSHAVWNNGNLSYLRDVNSPNITDDSII
ncbi:MAG: hypothetical protein PF904_04750 [Kiritimatiellae bacterium]|jgi:hypothetical protein|nr:hypothetical protein [Kiritimatiellia bacterium]